jgi:thiol:disulfide interchange protein
MHMGKALAILVGIILAALGVWGIVTWWSEYVKGFVLSAIVILAVFVGLALLLFGISELRSGVEEAPIAETPPPPPGGQAS